MDEILKYFSDLDSQQISQLEAMGPLYTQWNEKINVVSRKDIDSIYPHHILHSLAIAKFLNPVEGTTIMDLGTGGGLPGIPLAVLWPGCRFHLIDRIAKKLRVASEIAKELGLKNVTFQHGDSGECHEKFDYVVSRAVMDLKDLVKASAKNIRTQSANVLPTGLLCLKGGDLSNEIAETCRPVVEIPVSDWFDDPYFETKKLLYLKFGK